MMETAAIMALAAQCAPQVAPLTMAAIIQTESAGNPYAIGVNTGTRLARQPTSANEARRVAARLLAQGHNIDMGLGQINSANLEWLELDLRAVFDPCTNVRAAGQVLTHNFRQASRNVGDPQQALLQALSMYNTGSRTRGFRNGYVGKIQRSSARIAASLSDHGQATATAREQVAVAAKPEWRVF